MKKIILSSIVTISLVAMVGTAFAIKTAGPSAVNGLEHPGSASQLYLYQKDSNWNVVDGGAWGKMTFSSSDFVFNGHGLTAGTDYTLVRVADPWPQVITCLGKGVVNESGDIHIQGDWQSGGPKTWLVLSSDTDCSKMTGWHPASYLFEYNTI